MMARSHPFLNGNEPKAVSKIWVVVAGGLHLHSLRFLFLRLVLLHGIVLLFLLFGVLRGSLVLLQGFLHALGLLVGLALAVHGYLCLTLRGRGLGDCLVGIIGIGQRTAFLRAELQVHRGGYTLLVGHSVEFDGLALQVVTLLLVGELHALPLADGLDVAVLVRPLWTALLL